MIEEDKRQREGARTRLDRSRGHDHKQVNHGDGIVEVANGIHESRIALLDKMCESVFRLVLQKSLVFLLQLSRLGLLDLVAPSSVFAELVHEGVVHHEPQVFGQVVGVVLSSKLLRWLSWINSLQDTEFSIPSYTSSETSHRQIPRARSKLGTEGGTKVKRNIRR